MLPSRNKYDGTQWFSRGGQGGHAPPKENFHFSFVIIYFKIGVEINFA